MIKNCEDNIENWLLQHETEKQLLQSHYKKETKVYF